MPARKRAAVIGVPLDLGASKLGAAQGPEAIRRTDLIADLARLGLDAEDLGDVEVPERPKGTGGKHRRFLDQILKTCKALEAQVLSAHKSGAVPVVLGGDHSLAVGSAAGTARFFAGKKKSVGLIWVDAHADINTPDTSPSGNVHGMPVAHLLGMGDRKMAALGGAGAKFKARNVCLVGIRSVDENERRNLRESGVNVFTMKDVDRHGIAQVVEKALELACDGTDGIHLSFDIDAVDPAVAQGTGTPSRGGLTYRESHLLMEMVADSDRLRSLDMVEVNPLEDVHNNTAELASELIQSALGKRIY